MAYDLEEQETLDALKDWWAQYGTIIVVAVLVAAAAVAGWRGWQWYEGHQANQAMGYFEALESASRRTDEESIKRLHAASETLRSDFPKSGYTYRGVLVASKALQDTGDLDGAASQLQWLIDNGTDASLVQLARFRLANVLFDQGKLDEALAELENPSDSYKALYSDRRGDILYAKGDLEGALKEWHESLSGMSGSAASIVQLKIDAMSGA